MLRGDDGDFPVSVDYATVDGTASAGLKYAATNGTLTFAAGETDKTLVVPILNEGLVEGTEYFQVILSNPTGGAVLGTPATASVYITDNDTVPHHFTGITVLPDKTAMLSLDGSVSNLFNLSGTISNQFMQMFDLYPVEASSNLLDWT